MKIVKGLFIIARGIVFFVLVALLLPNFFVHAAAGVPAILNHQGRLLNGAGNLLGGTSGTDYCFRFSLYDDGVVGGGDNQLWPALTPLTMTVNVKNGVYNVGIGDTDAGSDVLDYNFAENDEVYLNIEVAAQVAGSCVGVSFENLSPRQRINAAAYAITSGNVVGARPSAIGTTTPIANTSLTVTPTLTTTVAARIRALAGQVADLFRVEDENGNLLVGIDGDGDIRASSTLQVTGSSRFYNNLAVEGLLTVSGSTGTSTFSSGLAASVLSLTNAAATSTIAGGLRVNGGLLISTLNCSGVNDLLQTDASGNIVCGSDDTGAGGGISTIQVDDSDVVTTANTLDFLGSDFDVTAAPAAEGNVAIDYTNSGITRRGQNETISGTWTFGSGLLAIGSTTFNGNATTTGMQGVGAFFINSDFVNDLTGTGLSTNSGALTVTLAPFSTSNLSEGSNLYYTPDRDIRFSTTSADYLQTQRNYFATTSADYWKTANNFFSTTSADYLQTVRNYFSTSSANAYINASSTIANASGVTSGNVLQWNGTRWISVATTTLGFIDTVDGTFATTSADYWKTQNNFFATSSADAWQITRNFFSTTSANAFINASSTIAHAGNAALGNLIQWNGTNWVAAATSTLGFAASTDLANYLTLSSWYATTTDGLDEGLANLYYTSDRDIRFSTTSADYLQTQRNYFATTSANAYINASSTIANAGNASFGNLMQWNGTRWVAVATSTLKVNTDDTIEGITNLFYTAARDIQFSTTSADYFQTQRNYFSTTSANAFVNASSTIAHAGNASIGNVMTWNGTAWVSTATSTLKLLTSDLIESGNLFYTSDRDIRFSSTSADYWKTTSNFFATTSADYWKTVSNFFSTTSADHYVNSSSTIANASGVTSGNVLQWNGTRWVSVATTTLGIAGTPDGSFSTTSADYWKTVTNFFATSSADAYINASSTVAHAGNASFGNVMVWNGTSWQALATSTLKVDLADTVGTLAIARGGTNAISQTTNGLTYFDGTSIISGTGLTFVNGNLGVGTTSPYAKLSVAGQVVGAYFTATTTSASLFPYASTTALSASAICLSGDCRELWPSGGAGGGTWSTTTSQVLTQFVNYSNNASDVVVIGSNSTTTGEFWFDPNGELAYFSGNVGIGTTSPYQELSISGDLALTGGIYDNSATRGTNGQILQTTGTGLVWVSTSTFKILTDDLIEGTSNLFYTPARFNASINASSTIAHAGNAVFGNVMTWNGSTWVSTATSTLKVNTDDTIEGLANLFYTADRDIRFSTTSADYLQTVRNYFSTSSANAFVNASTTIANASGVTSGNILQWNGTRWVSVATTTLGILNSESYINGSSTVAHAGNATFGNLLAWDGSSWQKLATSSLKVNTDDTIEGVANLFYTLDRDIRFSTTSADYLQTQRNYFSTTSASTFVNASSTIAHAGNGSFGNVLAWNGSSWQALATSTLKLLTTDLIEGSNLFYTSDRDIRFSTTSADYWSSLVSYFSTTSANAFINASNTIAHASGVTTGNLLQWNGSTWVSAATSTLKFNHTDLGNLAFTASGHTGTAFRLFGTNAAGAAAEYATSSLQILSDDTIEGVANLYYTSDRDIRFSTTSADYWKTLASFFSTTSANAFVNASATIAAAGNASIGNVMTWNGTRWVSTATSTLKVNTDDTIEGVANLFYTSDRDIRFSTTSADYLQTQRNYFSTTSASTFINASSTIAHAGNGSFGNVLAWNGSSWQALATSTFKILSDDVIEGATNFFYTSTRFNASVNGSSTIAHAGNATFGNVLAWNGTSWQAIATSTLKVNTDNTVEGVANLFYTSDRDIRFSTTSADYWATFASFFSTTSANAFINASTTIANAGNAAFGNVMTWNGTKWVSTATSTLKVNADDVTLGATNLFYTDARVATYISGSSTIPHVGNLAIGNHLQWNGTAWVAVATSTLKINTDDTIEGLTNLFYTSDRDIRFSTTSADYLQTQRNYFSTTSAHTFVNASSTIAHAGNASIGNVMTWNGSTWVSTATSTLKLLTTDLIEGSNLFYTSDRDIRFSTTSADYWSTTAGNFFSTTSANAFINASSTIAAAGNAAFGNMMTWSGSKWVSTATSTLKVNADDVTLGATNLFYTDARVATYISGSSTIPHVGNLAIGNHLQWNGTAWVAVATSTLKINTDDTIEGLTNLFYTSDRDIRFSTTSADYLQTQRNYFSTTSANTFVNASSTIAHAGNATVGHVLMWNGTNWIASATATCVAITGSADLCDGNDGGGGSGDIARWFTSGATGFLYNATTTDKVGVGTSSPMAKFSVHAGATDGLEYLFSVSTSTLTSTTTLFSVDRTGSTTIANGVNITDGCFAIDGVCLTAGTADGSFSTTSADYYVGASSTIAHAGNAVFGNILAWDGSSWQKLATSTLKVNTDDTIEGVANLFYTSDRDIRFSTTSADYLQTQRNYFSTTSASTFVNASSTIAHAGNASFGNVMTWNGTTWVSSATSTLKVLSDDVIEGGTNLFYTSDRDLRFSTTSADYWAATAGNFFSTTSANAFINASSTIAAAGNAAFGNVMTWSGSRWVSTATSTLKVNADDVTLGATNLFYTDARVATYISGSSTVAHAGNAILGNVLAWNGSSWQALATSTFKILSDDVIEGATKLFYTDARVGTYISGSSTVPHVGNLALNNHLQWNGTTWTAVATSTLKVNADDVTLGATNLFYTSTNFNASINASSTIAHASGVTTGNLLQWNGSTWVSAATSTLKFNHTDLGNLAFTASGHTGTAFRLFGTNASGAAAEYATSSLKILSDDVVEGATNLFYTSTRFNASVNGSTTIAHAGNAAFGNLLAWDGSSWQKFATSSLKVDLTDTVGTLAIARGGTNAITQTTNGLAFYNGSSITSGSGLTFVNGNLGVGTSSPYAKLSIHAFSTDTNSMLFVIASSTATATTTLFSVDRTGLTTFGDSSGTGDAVFQYAGDSNAWAVGYKSSDKSFNIASSTNLTGTAALSIAKNGNATFTGSGGTCTINGAGACTSDERLKEHIVEINGLEALEKLSLIKAVSYDWIDPALEQDKRIGLIAQEVLKAFPELVGSTTVKFQGVNGTYYTLDYAGLAAPLIAAVNELNNNLATVASTTASSTPSSHTFASAFFNNLFNRITTWLADATNGIQTFFAGEVHTDKLCVKKSDGTDVCLTGDELAEIISNGGTATVANVSDDNFDDTGGITSTSTPPTDNGTSTDPMPVPDATSTDPVVPPSDPAPEPTPDPAPVEDLDQNTEPVSPAPEPTPSEEPIISE